jgi:hypothetical protein
MQDQVQAEHDALRRARVAVASKAGRLPAASVRQLLVEQLATQGSDLPSDEVLDWQVSRIQATVPPGATFRVGILALARAYRNKRDSASELRSSVQHPQMISGPHGEVPYLVLADRSLPVVQVEVDQKVIATLSPEPSSVLVSLLHDGGDGQVKAEVAAYIGMQRVGVLSSDDRTRYQPAMTAARQAGAVLIVQGVITVESSGAKQLSIYAAGIL